MIKLSQETEALAARIAAAYKLPVDDAVRQALEAWAQAAELLQEPQRFRNQSTVAVARRKAGIDRAVADLAAMPVLDARSPNEIMDDLNAL